jgi:competence protein ComEA
MFRKSIPMVALAALLAVTMAYAQEGTSSGASSTTPATTTAPAKPAKAAKAMKSSSKKSAAAHMAKLDLNSASKEDLMKLPGVGDATADKIIAARPFKTKAELTAKGIVTKKEYAAIANKVIAKQEPAANATSK